VELHADVADVRPYLASCGMLAVPLRIGGGSRIKIYEAMAAARPVVSTPVGAEGLQVREGVHLALGDTPAAFAHRVIELLQDSERKRRLAENAHRFMLESCAWSASARRMHAGFAQLVSQVPADSHRDALPARSSP
jgi:glycosyltransferase involved in cell wall biosynthesis